MSKISLAAGLVMLAMAGSAAAVEIETARGPVEVAETPETIAVFDIAAVDTLVNLGIEIEGVPDTLYLPALSDALPDAEAVGTLFEPDLEALSALAPDLIVIGGRSSTTLESTSRVAPTIDMTMTGEDMIGEAKARIMAYGALFDENARAESLAGELDAAVSAARAAARGAGSALIVMTNGPKISVYGPGSRFGWVYDTLALEPAVSETEAATHGEAVSFEFIRSADPDWLIVLDRAAAIGTSDQNARATLDNELVAETTAWRNDQVVYMPAADFYIAAGGAGATMRVLKTLTDALSAAE